MIEIAKLEKTFAAETAADKWWDGLSKKEQQAYIKAHPRSKYARNAVSPSSVADKPKRGFTPLQHEAHKKLLSLGFKHVGLGDSGGGWNRPHSYEKKNATPADVKALHKAFRDSGSYKRSPNEGDSVLSVHRKDPSHHISSFHDPDGGDNTLYVDNQHFPKHEWDQLKEG